MIDRLIERIEELHNPTALGLDTCLDYLPDRGESVTSPAEAGRAIFEFNRQLIDAAAGLIPAVKVQIAYYEMYGVEGVRAFADTVRYAKEKGLIVIADAKRNDIGATAACYSRAFLGQTPLGAEEMRAFEPDFLTVTPYLGSDGIEPFVRDCAAHDKGIFVLVKTSNPSSGELQDMRFADGRTLYEAVGDRVAQWGAEQIGRYGYSNIGAVVGATYPEQGTALRERLKSVFFLLPGYGAQGASGADLAGCFDEHGRGGVVNASRSLLCAYRKEKYAGMSPAEAMVRAAEEMREDINAALKKAGKGGF